MTVNSLSSWLNSTTVEGYSSTSSASASQPQTNATTTQNQIPRDAPPEISKLSSLLGQLQDLQESDPTKYKEMATKIATKLRETASSASDSGDTRKAEGLNDLATKFESAAKTGEMVDLKPPQGPPPPPPPQEGEQDTSSTSSKYSDFLSMIKQDAGNDPMSVLSDTLSSLLES